MNEIIQTIESHPSLESAPKRDLTDRQRMLVDLIVENEEQKLGASFTSLAVRAGFGDGTNREASRTSATNALRKGHVQDALADRLKLTLGMGAVRATTELIRLATESRSEFVRMHSSNSILDRAGIQKPDTGLKFSAGQLTVKIDLS